VGLESSGQKTTGEVSLRLDCVLSESEGLGFYQQHVSRRREVAPQAGTQSMTPVATSAAFAAPNCAVRSLHSLLRRCR
jgi:hypothetical protein